MGTSSAAELSGVPQSAGEGEEGVWPPFSEV